MKKEFIAGLGISALILTACGGSGFEAPDPNPRPADAPTGEGLFSGKDGNLLGFLDKDKEGSGGANLGVNSYLWRASLEAISFMPVTQADSTGGVLLTDWYMNPNTPNERVKANIYILGKSLTPQNLKVSLFKQENNGGVWVSAPASPATQRQLEDAILTKARVLRVQEAR